MLAPLGPDRSVLEVGAPTWDAVVALLVHAAMPFVALEPPALVEALERVAARLAGSISSRSP